jgi:hypothetical protein
MQTNGKNNVGTVIFLPRFTVCQHASPCNVDRSHGGSAANRCFTDLTHTWGTGRTYPKSEGSLMTHFIRVALCGSHGVSTMPLPITSLELRTIFSRASRWRVQSTKPSRWWQLPRVTRNPQSQRFPSATKYKPRMHALAHSIPHSN